MFPTFEKHEIHRNKQNLVFALLKVIQGVEKFGNSSNSAARGVTKIPKFRHITHHLKSLHWLKIEQRIQYKILSLTYKSLQYNKPSPISDLLTIQPTRSTRSSAVVTLQRPSNPSRLKISDRSFYFQAPTLWNALPHHLRSHSHSSQAHSLLSLSSSQFHKQLKTHLFLHSYPP